MNTKTEHWERFLDPEVVRPSLFLATMFVTTFEILKDCLVDRVRDFYTDEWGVNGPTVDPGYEEEVLSRNRSALYASLDWLREHGAVDETDLETFEGLKKTRNLLAHQLFAVVTGQAESQHSTQFSVLVALLRKVEVWWVVNLEIPMNLDFADQEIDEAGIVPGAVLSLQILIEVASGNAELLAHWRKAHPNGGTEA